MLFSSVTFIFYFLPIVFILYYLSSKKFKNYILLFFSLIFYAWGGILYLPLLIISIFINYFFGLFIDKNKHNKNNKRKILIFSIIFNILFLGVFKYSNFICDNLNLIFNSQINIPRIPLPIGVSFYTFQAMSYVIDVYKETGKVQKNLFNLALYISMFPQLVAGPIVRYETIDNQINNRIHSFDKFSKGIDRFVIGFGKKVIISNSLGQLASTIYALDPIEISIASTWLGAIAYTLQIYFDFSGYSDMAIGLGKMFGFDFLENFNYPYISKSITEFWRRWHISLSTWFRDYVYIPLGGNRVSSLKIYRNLIIVWIITGIWHGASWNFIVWGLYFGFFIIIERLVLQKLFKYIPSILQHFYTLIVVIVGWVLFSSPNIKSAIEYIKIMTGIGKYPIINSYFIFYIKEYFIILIIGIIFSTPILKYIKNKSENKDLNKLINFLQPVFLVGLFISTVVYLVNSTFNPFIYFNF